MTQSTSSTNIGTAHGLRETRRYITGYDSIGNSISLTSPDLRYHDRGGYAISCLYKVKNIPSTLENDGDLQHYLESDGHIPPNVSGSASSFQLVVPDGANFVQGDFGPSASSVWHRTISVDFVTVVQGDLVLEVGEDYKDCTKVYLQQGDSIIQRGTMHRWVNPSCESPARFVATLLASRPFKVGDRIIEPAWVPKQ